MPLYVYALLQPPIAPLILPLGMKQPVTIVGNADLAAIVEPDLALEDWQQDDQQLMKAVLTHDRVVLELFQQVTLLPLRFGTQFGSPSVLLSHLATQQSHYRTSLQQLAGKAEYWLKLVPLEFPELPLSSELKGKAYFLAKKQQYQTQQNQQQQQQQELTWLVETIAQTQPYPPLLTDTAEGKKLYLLVEQIQADALAQTMQIWQQQCPHWQLSLSDPLPPYHFIGS